MHGQARPSPFWDLFLCLPFRHKKVLHLSRSNLSFIYSEPLPTDKSGSLIKTSIHLQPVSGWSCPLCIKPVPLFLALTHPLTKLKDLLLGRGAMTNLGSVLKSRDTTLPTKVHIVKAMIFPVVMCGCESWTIRKAECWRTDAFESVGEDSWQSLELQGDQTS